MSYTHVLLSTTILILLAVRPVSPGQVTNSSDSSNATVVVVEEEQYKCLTCAQSPELMCFSNQTCPEGKKYCYNFLWRGTNNSFSEYEISYYNNTREWGCTASAESCVAECAARNCNDSTCCDADLTLLNSGYSKVNHANYSRCYYGAATTYLIDLPMLCITLFVANWLLGPDDDR